VTSAAIAAGAQYQGFYLSEGAHFARHEALLELAGEAAEAAIDGAYLVSDTRHCDNTTVIVHAARQTVSRQAFRGVLSGKARGVYQGCVKVRREAQQTDAKQMSRTLLLSRKAEMVTKPELEIFADDVQCSHGATTGELDEAALFFLRARGIPEAEARAMLIEAFLGEALATIGSEALRASATAVVQDWLSAHAGDVRHVE
jgi:Fe-S cluster assembly protein SufD